MEISYSALSNVTGLVVMLTAYMFIRKRSQASNRPVSKSVEFMRKFFLFFGIFYLPISLPFIFLELSPSQFPMAMAVGFMIGHFFLYLAYMYTLRMTFSLVPQLADKDKWAIGWGIFVAVLGTSLALFTMVLGTPPSYDFSKHIVDYQQAPPLAATIAIGAIIAWIPAGIFFISHAIRNKGSRARSLLLGVGFITLTAVGPLHGLAQNWQTFVIADVATIGSIIMIGAGIAYKIKHDQAQPEAPAAAPANGRQA